MLDNKLPYSLNQSPEFWGVFLNTEDGWLSEHPERKDLLAFVRGGFKSKRLQKKFVKTPDRYAKRVIKAVWKEWELKRWWKLGKVMAEEVYSVLGRESFMRRVLPITLISPEDRKKIEQGGCLPPCSVGCHVGEVEHGS